MNSFVLSALTLCLVAQCSLASYQSAPSYGYQQQQQRKMAPSPQMYGHQQQQQQQQLYMPEQQYETARYEAPTPSYKVPAQYEQSSYPAAPAKSSYGRQQTSYAAPASYAKPAPAKYEEPYHPPMPFAWGYDINDGYGGAQYHKENGDEYGKRTGSYGYTDAYGIYRQVDYVADEHGFRATIKTNEPGTANESPADVDLHAYEPPSNYYAGNTYSAPQAPAKQYSAPATSSYTPAAPVAQMPRYQKPASSYSSKQQYSNKPSYTEQSAYSSSVLVPVYQKSAVPKLQLMTAPLKRY